MLLCLSRHFSSLIEGTDQFGNPINVNNTTIIVAEPGL
jgi:hypothetical protein